MDILTFENVTKSYNNNTVFEKINLSIRENEFIVIIGPSGSGKTTLLRLIAKLEKYDSGKIDYHNINDVSMVFQNYALFPNLNVYHNIESGLSSKKINKESKKQKIYNVAKILKIEDLLKRKPHQLSGGEKQRVALARALVRSPELFLLDEPLSNLDAKLKEELKKEIRLLYKKIGKTFIYVTHDQTEAIFLATKIVVMRNGVIEQFDTFKNIYENPKNIFVATFIKTPKINILEGYIKKRNKDFYLELHENKITLNNEKYNSKILNKYLNKKVKIGIRPESIVEGQTILMEIDNLEDLGKEGYIYGKVGTSSLTIKVSNIKIDFPSKDIFIFNIDTENNINRT